MTLQLAGLDGELQWISGQQLIVPAAGMAEDKFFVILDAESTRGRASQPLELQLVSEGEIIQTISTNFMAPTAGAQNQPR